MNGADRSFFCWGISHHNASISFREKISPDQSQLDSLYQQLGQQEWLSEMAILSTCNRFELYGASYELDPVVLSETLGDILKMDPAQLREKSTLLKGEPALQHLFAVTAGLDSQIVGEVEITGQVKQAFLRAAEQRTVGRLLNKVFQKNFQTSKWIRSNTEIGKGNINVATVAVDLAIKVFGNLDSSPILVIGAGDIAEKIMAALRSRGANHLAISNRTYEKALELAKTIGGKAVPIEELDPYLSTADVILCSTSSQEFILTEDHMKMSLKKRGVRPLCLLDLALPRDIDPSLDKFANIFLYNLDDLAEIAESNLKARREELGKCHDHIEKKIRYLLHGRAMRPPQVPETKGLEQT